MARVIENVARDGVEVERMHARFATVEAVSADDETLVYVLGEETVVWLGAGEHHVFGGPTRVLLAAARESGGRSGAGA